MLKQQRHEHDEAAARSLAAQGRRTSSTRALCSSQQAAAAWAWFEHGGSTCITPSKAEGLILAKRNAQGSFASPSRFKKEHIMTGDAMAAIPHQASADDAIAKGHGSRRFQDDLHDLGKRSTSDNNVWRFSSSCRSSPTSLRFNIDEGPDQDDAEDEVGGITSYGLQVDDQASPTSLFDKFEVDALCRQLNNHGHLYSRSAGSISCTAPCSAELQEYYETQKGHQDHPQAVHIKPRRYFKSRDVDADDGHDQNFDHDVVHRLLRFPIKTSKSSFRSTSAAPAAFCSSIATVDSIVDHLHRHHPASPKQVRAVATINQTSKRHETCRHDRGNRQNTSQLRTSCNHSGEFKSNQILETRGDYSTSIGHRPKSQQKMPGTSDQLELIGRTPRRRRVRNMHHADLLYSKVLKPLMSRLMSAHGAGTPIAEEDDGVARTNAYAGHRHFHKHHHIIHHHYHHLLQNINEASQDAVLQLDHLITKNDGAHDVLHPPKLNYSFHQEEIMRTPASSSVQYCSTALIN